MDPSEKLNLIKNRLSPREVDALETSMMQLREVEALFSDNPTVYDACLDGIESARKFAYVLAAGDKNPEQVFDPVHDGTTSVEEFRAALRTLVEKNQLTPELARAITWKDVEELMAAQGNPLSEISEETRVSAVYVAEPPRRVLLTKEDLILDVDLRRAAADRHRQQTQERSWSTLVTHIGEICRQVIEDSETLHQDRRSNDKSSPEDFQEVASLLSYVPKQFRRQAFCQCIFGTSEFERMPIIVEEDGKAQFSTKLFNVRIPMPVPFGGLPGGQTILAWKNFHSGQWEHQIPSCAAEIEMPKTFLDLDFESFIERAATDRTGLGQLLFIVEKCDPDTVGAEWKRSTLLRNSLQSVHIPDVNHGTDRWYDVIRMARASFGSDLPAETLIRLMGLSKLEKKSDELTTKWPFAPQRIPKNPFTISRFKEIYRQILKQKQSMNSGQVDLEAVREIIKLMPE